MQHALGQGGLQLPVSTRTTPRYGLSIPFLVVGCYSTLLVSKGGHHEAAAVAAARFIAEHSEPHAERFANWIADTWRFKGPKGWGVNASGWWNW